LLLLTGFFSFLLSRLKPYRQAAIAIRVLGYLLLIPLVLLVFWFWLSGFYEIVHYNAFEYLKIFVSGKFDTSTKLGGLCVSFDFHYYLDANQGVFCKRF